MIRTGFVSLLAAVGFAGSTGGNPPDGTSPAPSSTTQVHTRVEVRPEKHKSGEVTYHYRVLNLRTSPLAEIKIGLVPSLDEPELMEPPIEWIPGANDCPRSMSAPRGWTACVGRQEESDRHFLIFAAQGDSAFLRAGAELAFAVTVARPDSAYRTARFWALSTELPHDEGRVMEAAAVE